MKHVSIDWEPFLSFLARVLSHGVMALATAQQLVCELSNVESLEILDHQDVDTLISAKSNQDYK